MSRKVAENNLLPVAQIVKSYDTTGEVVIKYTSDLLQDHNLKEPVFLYFDGLPVPFFISALKNKGNSGAILKFETSNDFRHSEELLRKEIFLPASNVNRDALLQESDSMARFLNGCTVKDQNNKTIGILSDYLDIPGNPCIEVTRGASSIKEQPASPQTSNTVLLPFNENLILKFDPAKRILQMNIPSGLLEL